MLGRCRVAVFTGVVRRCEVTRGNDVVAPCLIPDCVWRELLEKKKITKLTKIMFFFFFYKMLKFSHLIYFFLFTCCIASCFEFMFKC